MTTPSVTTRTGSQQAVIARRPSPWAYETGEFPVVVVHGESIDDIRVSVEGSPGLLALVQKRLNTEGQTKASVDPERARPPKAFLSYSFEDSNFAEKLAKALMANGIETWWAEWEINAGDSLRQKIDDGLGSCTHFIALLTPESLQKPWVQQEMDAGLVRRINGQAKFIPLRYGLSTRELPPLLGGMHSPAVSEENFDQSVVALVNDIHEVTRKPAMGDAPAITSLPATAYSPIATAIARVFVEETKTAMFADPQKDIDELEAAIAVPRDDIEDALHELRAFVIVRHDVVLPKDDLFSEFDGYFKDWSADADALKIAADLISEVGLPHQAADVAQLYGWQPRRLNPALTYLLSRGLIVDYKILSSEFTSYRVVKTDATRRFVKSRM